jgi:hypothetical protein
MLIWRCLSILKRLRLNDSELRFNSLKGKGIAPSFKCPDGPWGPLRLVLNMYWNIKRSGHETDLSPSTNSEAKNARNYVSASHEVPTARCSINHRKSWPIAYLFMYSFIHFLFNDLYTVSNGGYSANNKKEKMYGRRQLQPNLRYYLCLWLEGLRRGRKASVAITGFYNKIWSRELRNTKYNCWSRDRDSPCEFFHLHFQAPYIVDIG